MILVSETILLFISNIVFFISKIIFVGGLWIKIILNHVNGAPYVFNVYIVTVPFDESKVFYTEESLIDSQIKFVNNCSYDLIFFSADV